MLSHIGSSLLLRIDPAYAIDFQRGTKGTKKCAAGDTPVQGIAAFPQSGHARQTHLLLRMLRCNIRGGTSTKREYGVKLA